MKVERRIAELRGAVRPWRCSVCAEWESAVLVGDDALVAWLIRERCCLRCAAWSAALAEGADDLAFADGMAWRGEVWLGALPRGVEQRQRSAAPAIQARDDHHDEG